MFPFLSTLIMLPVDAVIIMVLMQVLAGEKANFMKSLVTAVIGAVAAAGLTYLLGFIAYPYIIAAAIVAVCVGVAISLLFQVSIQRAAIIAVVFLILRSGIIHIVLSMIPGVSNV